MGLKKVSRRRRIAEARPPTADTPAGERPEWLPEGLGVEMRRRGNDTEKFDQYYLSPVSSKIFRSKLEVFHHLATGSGMVEDSEGQASRLPSGGKYNLGPRGGKVEKSELHHTNKRLLAALEDYPLEWLPHGWFVEYGTWTDGVSGPENYKCYIDPLTGSRFYSKEAVVCYLETHKLCNPTLNEGGSTNANPTDFCSSSPKETTSMDRPKHVFCQIDYSPSGLPSGWIKEVRITKTKTSQKIRRDAYYIDTVTGYGFRSHKDADRYLEDKDISRIAFKLYKSQLPKVCSLAKETLHPVAVRRAKVKKTAVRGHLFSRQMQKGYSATDRGNAQDPNYSAIYMRCLDASQFTAVLVFPAIFFFLNCCFFVFGLLMQSLFVLLLCKM
ncbi:methyl-CpG-binding domain-containing protein 13 [Iris pallida]|uniref:Methyl-CpG-binding domain-containing protein 13 n=1 Tax=Iris pallida TaxID=29817 RepID=A0AAX6IMP3_IRIPA|nr:methyl-CpG-binding domain-containing protein 13 [Iris pallida]KAJ6854173.1 methyl-CpG-binding domain-containing protein 13 [Iris pallida]